MKMNNSVVWFLSGLLFCGSAGAIPASQASQVRCEAPLVHEFQKVNLGKPGASSVSQNHSAMSLSPAQRLVQARTAYSDAYDAFVARLDVQWMQDSDKNAQKPWYQRIFTANSGQPLKDEKTKAQFDKTSEGQKLKAELDNAQQVAQNGGYDRSDEIMASALTSQAVKFDGVDSYGPANRPVIRAYYRTTPQGDQLTAYSVRSSEYVETVTIGPDCKINSLNIVENKTTQSYIGDAFPVSAKTCASLGQIQAIAQQLPSETDLDHTLCESRGGQSKGKPFSNNSHKGDGSGYDTQLCDCPNGEGIEPSPGEFHNPQLTCTDAVHPIPADTLYALLKNGAPDWDGYKTRHFIPLMADKGSLLAIACGTHAADFEIHKALPVGGGATRSQQGTSGSAAGY